MLCFVISACFYYNKFAARDKRVFVFPAPWSSSWPLVLALAPGPGSPICIYRPTRQFAFTGSGSQFVFTNPGPKFVFTGPCPKFLFTGPGQSGAWACIYQLVPPICIYWLWPTIFIAVLWICIYLLICSSSCGSSNISNSSNFLGLDNTNISMPISVN